MRIIAGQFRGRTLSTVQDLTIRPTTDRAKQTIFDILSNRMEFEGIRVLDLFAGSGSLGLEALSRGAQEIVFVEKSRSPINALESNISALKCEQQCTVYPADVFWYLKHTQQAFDLVFVDPPYKLEEIGTLPSAIYNSSVVNEGSYVVMEHSKESEIELSDANYEITRKTFGQTIVLILRTKSRYLETKGEALQ